MGEHDNHPDDFVSLVVAVHSGDKNAVDLQSVDLEALQAAERRVAGAEVVNVQTNAECLQSREHGGRLFCVGHSDGLRNLEIYAARMHATLLEKLANLSGQIGLGELFGADVDAEGEGWARRKQSL